MGKIVTDNKYVPISMLFGGGPTPGKTHNDYVTELDKRLEQAYEMVREHLKVL